MYEFIAGSEDDQEDYCSSLLKNANEYLDKLKHHRITITTTPKQIHEQLELLDKCIDYIERAHTNLPPAHYKTLYAEDVTRKTVDIISHLNNIVNVLSKQGTPRTEQELKEKEGLYLKIVSLFNALKFKEPAINTLVKLCIMIKKYVSLSDQSNIDEKMAKLYEYTCDVIKMCSKDYSPPKELPITDIFERFARILHHKNSLLARDVLLSALDHSKNGHYHDQHSIYLCFKGLGANYVKLADRRSGYINDDNADTEIDACYQLAINYFKKALEFSKNQVLENVDNRYCFLMLSISNVRLAAHYQHLYAKFCHANLLAQIEHWYREAIRWAHEANDRRKAGIGYNQLAHHFYSQGLMREAINHWQLAIDNLISDLEAHPDVPFQLISMKTAYQQNTHALHPDDPRYIDFCSRLAKDLIDLGHALKAREMSSFYQTSPRQTQSVSEDHNSQSFLTRATMIGRK